ncbi:hypothetical protein IQ07DRAFT_215126 [Pyrenochaeta sp. DS3sAY3a]|nr:hypothetical protein IQ07DRAFT_215126 [Pyrenochaeta sp. DS3sAY3a]
MFSNGKEQPASPLRLPSCVLRRGPVPALSSSWPIPSHHVLSFHSTLPCSRCEAVRLLCTSPPSMTTALATSILSASAAAPSIGRRISDSSPTSPAPRRDRAPLARALLPLLASPRALPVATTISCRITKPLDLDIPMPCRVHVPSEDLSAGRHHEPCRLAQANMDSTPIRKAIVVASPRH